MFPVSNGSSDYSPVTVFQVTGQGDLTVKAKQGPAPTVPGLPSTRSYRYWTPAKDAAITGASVTFQYSDYEIYNSNENNYRLYRIENGAATLVPATFDQAANTATITNVTANADYAIADHRSSQMAAKFKVVAVRKP
jgi:hypothetical protein